MSGNNSQTKRTGAFRWAVGVESSCIPHLSIDQYQWTQHDRFWKDDFKRISDELGSKWARYSLPWHIVEPARGRFDWRWADERIEFASSLGINLILDLVHFGTPTWLPEAFGDVDFPIALEAYSRAFAERYGSAVHSVCPINEPLITSLFCGDVGLWPPHGRSLRAYTAILSRVAQGLSRSIQALRELAPDVEVVVCDALEFPRIEAKASRVAAPALMQVIQDDLTLRLQRRHVVIDLITGRVDQEHPLHSWLEKNGLSTMDMNWFLRNPVQMDVLGLDYYCHSEMELYPCSDDHFRQRVPKDLAGLHRAVRDYWKRYHLPMMITETSYYGDDTEREKWLNFTVNDICKLRAEGIPVIGYTWWPLLDHLDWDGALLHRIGRIHHVGVYRLERDADGSLIRRRTPLTTQYQQVVAQGDAIVGPIRAAIEKKATQGVQAGKSARDGKDDLEYVRDVIHQIHRIVPTNDKIPAFRRFFRLRLLFLFEIRPSSRCTTFRHGH